MIRAYGDYDAKSASIATALVCLDPSKAVQDQKEEADINNIVRQFGVTGVLPQGIRTPTYDDFTGVSDYREAVEVVREAEKNFMAMPAEIRDRFQNDPQAFLEFCGDSANLPEMRKLGLAVPEKEVLPKEGLPKKKPKEEAKP